MVVQNIDMIFLKIYPETNEVYLPKNRFLVNQKLGYLLPFFGENSETFNGVPLIDVQEAHNVFLDVFEADKDYKYKNVQTALLNVLSEIKTPLNCIVDFDITRFTMSDMICQTNSYLAVASIYCNELKQSIDVSNNDSITLRLSQPAKGIYKLKDFGGYNLNGKRIKQLLTKNGENCYITIRTTDNKNNFLNVPLRLFEDNLQIQDNKIYFDSISVDSDNTTITVEANKNDDILLTFKY